MEAEGVKTVISVVVASYNGEKYILEQLDSIANQTMVPDEVIIRDDGSSDNTVNLVREYIETNKLSGWRIEVGENNIGWKANFHRVIKSSKGSIIFLCDQDDIWMRHKIETLVSLMSKNIEIELIASSYKYLIDEKVTDKKEKIEGLEKMEITPGFFHLHYPGAVFAIRQSLVKEMEPFWDESMPHDAQLWNLAVIRHTAFVYHEPLILYRRHENTATGREGLSLIVKRKNIELEEKTLILLKDYDKEKDILNNREKKILDDALKHVNYRNLLVLNHELIYIFKILKTIKHYSKRKTYFGDVLTAIKRK